MYNCKFTSLSHYIGMYIAWTDTTWLYLHHIVAKTHYVKCGSKIGEFLHYTPGSSLIDADWSNVSICAMKCSKIDFLWWSKIQTPEPSSVNSCSEERFTNSIMEFLAMPWSQNALLHFLGKSRFSVSLQLLAMPRPFQSYFGKNTLGLVKPHPIWGLGAFCCILSDVWHLYNIITRTIK